MSSLADLPNMKGFSATSVGFGAIIWNSPCHLLADRDLTLNEKISVWAVRHYDGWICKCVTWVADAAHLSKESWPTALAKAINADTTSFRGSVLIKAGHIDDTDGTFKVSGTATTSDAPDLESNTNVDRLWVFGGGMRLYTNAPFRANQVEALSLPDTIPTQTELPCIQLRDRTTTRLYETHIYAVNSNVGSNSSHINEFAKQINANSRYMRAGVLDTTDKVTITTANTGNRVYVCQMSDLVATLSTINSFGFEGPSTSADFPATGSGYIHVHDDVSGTPLPGSPFTFSPTDRSKGAWPQALSTALAASELKHILKLDTSTPSSYIWKRAGIPLRIWFTGAFGTPSSHAAFVDESNQPVTFGQLLKKFADSAVLPKNEGKPFSFKAATATPEEIAQQLSENEYLDDPEVISRPSSFYGELVDTRTGLTCSTYTYTGNDSVDTTRSIDNAWNGIERAMPQLLRGTNTPGSSQNAPQPSALPPQLPDASGLSFVIDRCPDKWQEQALPEEHNDLLALTDKRIIDACYLEEAGNLYTPDKASWSYAFDSFKLNNDVWTQLIKDDCNLGANTSDYLVREANNRRIDEKVKSYESLGDPFAGKNHKYFRLPKAWYIEKKYRDIFIGATAINWFDANRILGEGDTPVHDTWWLTGLDLKTWNSSSTRCTSTNVDIFLSSCSNSGIQAILNISLSKKAIESGIRLIDVTSPMIDRKYGRYPDIPLPDLQIAIHRPDGGAFGENDIVCFTSYVTPNELAKQAHATRFLKTLFHAPEFVPEDTLCVDYSHTLGSDLYDIRGPEQNGIDPYSGLFHACYDMGSVRGLKGQGPTLDLSLHYSPMRANEGGLGDGWALRFSYFDNRTGRLTLKSGQTIDLSAKEIDDLTGTTTATLEKKDVLLSSAVVDGTRSTGLTCLKSITISYANGYKEIIAKPQTHDEKEAGSSYLKSYKEKLAKIRKETEKSTPAAVSGYLRKGWSYTPAGWLFNLITKRDTSGRTAKERQSDEDYKAFKKDLDDAEAQINRKAFLLVPTSITSAEGGQLDLSWEGSKGHVLLKSIKDNTTSLLTVTTTGALSVKGDCTYVFTFWPGQSESYKVTLHTSKCLLNSIVREQSSVTERTISFFYHRDEALDRVLKSVQESDGSLEVVEYANRYDAYPPSARRHTLVPGANQCNITHAWTIKKDRKSAGSCVSRQTLITGINDGKDPFVERRWKGRYGLPLMERQITQQPDSFRTEISYTYEPIDSDALKGIGENDTSLKLRILTTPLSVKISERTLAPPKHDTSFNYAYFVVGGGGDDNDNDNDNDDTGYRRPFGEGRGIGDGFGDD